MRTVFKDGTLQGRYERNGYVTVPAFDVEQVEELRQQYSGLPPIDDAGWSMRVFLGPASHSQVIDGLLARYLRDYIVLSGGSDRRTRAELIHFIRQKETNRLQKYRVPLDFILRCNTGHPPEPPLDGATFVRNVDELQPFTQEEMALFLATREAIPSQNSRAV